MEASVEVALLLRSLLSHEKQWTGSEAALAKQLTTAMEASPPLWIPQTGPQTLAYLSQADELFYGGSAGGGKSDLLLGLASTAHRRSLILRRQSTQLRELTDRVQEVCGGVGRWRSSGHGGLMRDLPGDRRIELDGCEYEQDKEKFKGRPHDLKAFDELSDFSETQFDFISAWNRTVFRGQRCRKVGAGNPPTSSEGEWVIRRWAPWLDDQHPRPAAPSEVRYYAMVDGKWQEREDSRPFDHQGVTLQPIGRTFIPALLDDNPILKSTGYGVTLMNLPEPLRSQLLHGNFKAGRQDDEWQLIPTDWVRLAMARWRPGGGAGQKLDVMGVDVARAGRDQTMLAKRYGKWVAPLVKIPGAETTDGPAVAGKVLLNLEDTSAAIHIDIIGVGSSPYDSLKGVEVVKLKVYPVNFAAATKHMDRSRKLRMRNVRAEAYWRLREALEPKMGEDLALPPDPELLADLTAPRWKMTATGVLIEEKEEIKKRIGRSPDCGDAVAMTMLPVRTITGWGMQTA